MTRVLTATLILVAGLALLAPRASAQTDEIQVYDAVIEPVGVYGLELHTNFTPIGRKVGAFPGAIIPNDSVNGAWEWAYGVTPWMEQGLYLPVWSPYSSNHGFTINGFKIRELFVSPNAAKRPFFYGLNFEFSVNALYWEPRRFSSELRPIVGVHLHQWDLIYNPIVDTDFTGGIGGLQFNPAGRVAYNFNDKWAVAAEQYDGWGELHQFLPVHDQFHESWAVLDRNTKLVDIETGVGYGYTAGSDRLTLKLMFWRDLNPKH